MIKGFSLVEILPSLIALAIFAALFVLLSAQTIRRQAQG